MEQIYIKEKVEKALMNLLHELNISNLNRLWDEANETSNRANWYKRLDPRSSIKISKKHIDKLITGLETNGYNITQAQKYSLYSAIDIPVVIKPLAQARPNNYIPFQRSSLFQAQPAQFEKLGNLLLPQPEDVKTRKGLRQVGIIGLGGIGKTQLAVEAAYHFQHFFPEGVFWLNAPGTTQYGWQQKLANLALSTNYLPPEDDPTHPERELRLARYLAAYFATHSKALLIVDNLDEPGLLATVLPALAGQELICTILYTSRSRLKLPGSALYKMEQLPEADAFRLILETTRPTLFKEFLLGEQNNPEIGAARDIYRLSGGLPLALIHLRALLLENPGLTLLKLAQVLKERGALEVLDEHEPFTNSLPATFRLSWEKVQQVETQRLFMLAAFFPEAEPIPSWLLGLISGLGEKSESFEPLGKAYRKLYELSLLEELQNGLVRLHPLVREFAQRLILDETTDGGVELLRDAGMRLINIFSNIEELENRATLLPGGYFGCLAQVSAALRYLNLASQALRPQERNSIEEAIQNLQQVDLWLNKEIPLLGVSGLWPAKIPALFYQQLYNQSMEEGYQIPKINNIKVRGNWIRKLERVGTEDQALARIIRAHSLVVFSAALSPGNNEFILTGSEDYSARLWDTSSGHLLRNFEGHQDFVKSVAFSSDHVNFVLTGSLDKTIRLWETATGKLIWIFEGHEAGLTCVTFSAANHWIASGSEDFTARIWNVQTRHLELTLPHARKVNCVAFLSPISYDKNSSPNENYQPQLLATACDDAKIRIWEVPTGRLLAVFEGHSGPVNTIVFSPDGRYLLSGAGDSLVCLWSTEEFLFPKSQGYISLTSPKLRHPLKIFRGHIDGIASVAFSRDGTKILSGGDWERIVHLWEVESGKIVASFSGHNGCVYSVAFFEDNNIAMSASEDRTVRIWNVARGRPITDQKREEGGMISDAIFSPDGSLVLSGHWDGTAHLWDTTSGGTLLKVLRGAHTARVRGVAFSRDGLQLATSSFDNTAALWNIATGKLLRRFEGHDAPVRSVAISPDNRFVLTGSYDNTAKLWNVQTGKVLANLRAHRDWVIKTIFSNNGSLILTGSKDHTAVLWDTASCQPLFELKEHTHWVLALAFSQDDKKFVTATAGEALVRIWNTTTGRLLHVLAGHNMDIYHVSFSPDGRILVSGDRTGEVRFWEVESGQLLGVYTATYEVGDVYWLNSSKVIMVDKGGTHFQPHIHSVVLENFSA